MKLVALAAILGVSVVAVAAQATRAEACGGFQISCADSFCGEDRAIVIEGTLMAGANLELAEARITVQIDRAFGAAELRSGMTVDLEAAQYAFYAGDVGLSLVLYGKRDAASNRVVIQGQHMSYDVAECFTEDTSAAAVAAMAGSDQCWETMTALDEQRDVGAGCSAGGTSGGLVAFALLGLVAAKRRGQSSL